MNGVYLDYNATSLPRPAAVAAALDALRAGGNPSSVHAAGRAARARLESARRQVAALVGAAPKSVIFTSGATEANALALAQPELGRILVSEIEHDSVLASAPAAERIPVTADGCVDLEALDQILSRDAPQHGETLVAVMAVNNETGVVQPMNRLSEIAARHGARLHVDAVQAAGRRALDIAALGRASLSLSAHKIGGPAGAGALVLGNGVAIDGILRGGGQERNLRAGTENLSGIAGFAAAADEVMTTGSDECARIGQLRDRLERTLLTLVPDAIVIGRDAPRVANTCCLALPGLPAERQVIALDLAGVQVSAGSACSSGKVTRSHVLSAMGLDDDVAGSAIRVSLGWASTEEDVDRFLEAYGRLADRAAA